MKAIFLFLSLILTYFVNAESDTTSHIEKINGKLIVVREIIQNNETFVTHDVPRIITMILIIISIFVFIFHRPKSNKNA